MQKQKFLDVIFKIFLVFGVQQNNYGKKCAANQKRLRTTGQRHTVSYKKASIIFHFLKDSVSYIKVSIIINCFSHKLKSREFSYFKFQK